MRIARICKLGLDSYALNDRVQLQAGSDQPSGPAHSFFGQLRRNRLAFVRMRVTF